MANDAEAVMPVANPGRWPEHMLRLVDVGGAGGLQSKWVACADQIIPILFEPSPSQAELLRDTLKVDFARAEVIESGLSNVAGPQTLNIANFWGCTSLLQPNWDVLSKYRIAGLFGIARTVPIVCTRYDALHAAGAVPAPDVIKIDVQGYESEVLQGFGGLLQGCLGIELETHVYPIYRDQKLLHDLIAYLADYGFVLRKMTPVPNFDGDVVEVDAWFTKDIRHWRQLSPTQLRKFALMCQVWEIEDVYGQIDPQLYQIPG